MSTIYRGVLICALILVTLHLWAAVFPSHYNWGYHYFAFFPAPFSLAALGAALLLFIPRVRVLTLSWLGTIATRFDRFHPIKVFALLLAGWVTLMLCFPVRLHLLGDSELIIQLTPRLPSIDDSSANFRNQPLTYLLLRGIQWLMGMGGVVEPLDLYRVADGVAGVLYLGVIFYFLKSLRAGGIESVLLGTLLLIRVGTQFFFGYVENYMFFYLFLSAYIVTGWQSLEGRLPVWVPLIILALTPAFHLAGVVFVPTALFLLLPIIRKHPRYVPAAITGAVGVFLAMIFYLGPSWVLTRIGDAFRNDLLPFLTPPGGIPYGMFSAAHLVDWGNAYLHISPLSIACVGLGLIFLPHRDYAGSPVFRFLLATTVVGIGLSFVIVPALGMARDWDMLSNFFSPLRFLTIFFLIIFLREKKMRHAVLVMTVISVLRLAGWIGINADEGRHLSRAVLLTEPVLSGTFPTIYYENLARTFYAQKDYLNAVRWYERYMSLDSANPRILANLSECYGKVGEKEKQFGALERSVSANSGNPGVYSNLALQCLARGDTTRAIGLLTTALSLDSSNGLFHANLAIIALQRGDFPGARKYSDDAIRLGLADPQIFRIAGKAHYALAEYREAAAMFDRYLLHAPNDQGVQRIYADIRSRLDKPPSPESVSTEHTSAPMGLH